MSIILFQQLGAEIRVIDFIHDSGKGFEFYIDLLQKRKELHRFIWGDWHFPHDITVREMGSGQTRLKTIKDLMAGAGVRGFKTGSPMAYPANLVPIRNVLPRCWFDGTRCRHLISALSSYRRKYNETTKMYMDLPLHDWSSHPVASFRELAIAVNKGRGSSSVDQRAIDKHRKLSLKRPTY